jgi:hypothetical protein
MNKDKPICKWWVSMEQPECGNVATDKIKVKTRIVEATVDVCHEHKVEHNRRGRMVRTTAGPKQ